MQIAESREANRDDRSSSARGSLPMFPESIDPSKPQFLFLSLRRDSSVRVQSFEVMFVTPLASSRAVERDAILTWPLLRFPRLGNRIRSLATCVHY